MTAGAWLFLGIAWGGITVLVIFCYYKVFTTGPDKPSK